MKTHTQKLITPKLGAESMLQAQIQALEEQDLVFKGSGLKNNNIVASWRGFKRRAVTDVCPKLAKIPNLPPAMDSYSAICIY